RFGALNLDNFDSCLALLERPKGDKGWGNVVFFIVEPEIFDYSQGEAAVLEIEP
ncbi:glucose-1-phosphate cytidylyltransferase, partial [Candidatus Hakubella thermalkaliphila]